MPAIMSTPTIIHAMRRAAMPHLNQLFSHPFNIGLRDGTLPRIYYEMFLEQDAMYLKSYAEALHHVARRLPTGTHQDLFLHIAHDVVQSEMNLHRNYLSKPRSHTLNMIPAIQKYTSSLLTAAEYSPLPIAMARLLPCLYEYGELGLLMKPFLNLQHPYHAWVKTYSGEDFLQYRKEMTDAINHIGAFSDTPMQHAMMKAYVESTQHELAFLNNVCFPGLCFKHRFFLPAPRLPQSPAPTAPHPLYSCGSR